MSTHTFRSRLVRSVAAASVLAVLSVGAVGSPALADAACTGDLCVVGNVVDTPAGPVTVTVTAGNVVSVHLAPLSSTLMVGVPFMIPPGPPGLPGCAAGCITFTRTTISTAAGVVDIDSIVYPAGQPFRLVLPNLVVVSIHPPGPCRVKTVGTTVTFTPLVPPTSSP